MKARRAEGEVEKLYAEAQKLTSRDSYQELCRSVAALEGVEDGRERLRLLADLRSLIPPCCGALREEVASQIDDITGGVRAAHACRHTRPSVRNLGSSPPDHHVIII